MRQLLLTIESASDIDELSLRAGQPCETRPTIIDAGESVQAAARFWARRSRSFMLHTGLHVSARICEAL